MKNTEKYSYAVILIVILDQLTKYLIRANFSLHESYVLIKGFLNLTFITNTGSAFGIFNGFNSSLVFFSLAVLGFIIYYWDKVEKYEKPYFYLISGGIIGNLIDRIVFGHVIDFISVLSWPAFNVADSALTIGIIGLIYLDFRK